MAGKRKPTGNPVGRPKKKTSPNPVGRPKGEASIMKDYRQRMLNSPKSPKVLDAIMNAALDDEHKNQAAAWKLIMDRIAPISGFEKEAGGTGRAKMVIEIKDAGVVHVGTEEQEDALGGSEEALEADYEELRDMDQGVANVAQKPRVTFSEPPKDGIHDLSIPKPPRSSQ